MKNIFYFKGWTYHVETLVSTCYYRENNSADYSYFYLFSCFHHDTQVNPGLLLVSLPLIHHYVHKSTYLLTYYTIFHDVIRNCVISNINKTDLMTVYTHHDCQKGGYYLKKKNITVTNKTTGTSHIELCILGVPKWCLVKIWTSIDVEVQPVMGPCYLSIYLYMYVNFPHVEIVMCTQ